MHLAIDENYKENVKKIVFLTLNDTYIKRNRLKIEQRFLTQETLLIFNKKKTLPFYKFQTRDGFKIN